MFIKLTQKIFNGLRHIYVNPEGVKCVYSNGTETFISLNQTESYCVTEPIDQVLKELGYNSNAPKKEKEDNRRSRASASRNSRTEGDKQITKTRVSKNK